jgi:hypothetical protein
MSERWSLKRGKMKLQHRSKVRGKEEKGRTLEIGHEGLGSTVQS